MVGREGNTYFVLYVPTRIFHKLTLILSSQRLLDVAPPYLRYDLPWSLVLDLNQRPFPYQGNALPAKLSGQI